MISFGPYSKAIVGVLGAIGTWAIAALADNVVSPQEWVALALAILTGAGIYQVTNASEPGVK